MKKVIEGTFILFLTCFSFYYTDKVINLINERDPLMVEIVNIKNNYEILPVGAIIDDDTIIPGILGKEVDVDKSYNNMKSSGIFREEALIFKDLYPNTSLKDNKDKYIIRGNSTRKTVAILVILNNNVDDIKKIDNVTVFMNHSDLTIANINLLKDKEIYTYGNNGIYSSEILTSDNAVISKLSNNKSNYCMIKNKDDNILNLCNKKNMYVVIPSVVGGYYEVKNNLSNGSIILLDNLNDIDVIVKYIKSKGYDIVTLSTLLRE